MLAEKFVAEAKRTLSPILGDKGATLYSSFKTLAPGKFYILGLNPGGPVDSGQTLAESLDCLPEQQENAYLDEDWSSTARHFDVGQHPLQRHLSELMREIGQDLQNVCASNLIFTRSPGQHGADYPARGHVCWPVHQMILDIVKPNVIIAFGNGDISPYAFLALKHHETMGVWPKEVTHPAQYWTWQCKAFQTEIEGRDILVFGLPHLSRYTIRGRPEVTNWIKKTIGEHDNGVRLAGPTG